MKGNIKLLFVVVASVLAGAYVEKWQSTRHGDGEPAACLVTDTVTQVDTVPYFAPQPKREVKLGTVVRALPARTMQNDEFIMHNAECTVHNAECTMQNDEFIMHNAECSVHNAEWGTRNVTDHAVDSVEVEIPITQREYEGEEYHAWVSGYEPSLDSILVFPKSKVVTVRERGNRKRWHIGPALGWGFTPQGLQPYIGVSVTYSIFSW